MTIGCLFGTFDPPHLGHIKIARWMREHIPFDAVWLVITPDNPFKHDHHKSSLGDRTAMCRLAIQGIDGLALCDEEKHLPAPHYTVDSLAHFRQRWPEHQFSLIIGGDNLLHLDRWKEPHEILGHHAIYVYPRGNDRIAGSPIITSNPNLRITDAPRMDVSSTAVRHALHNGDPTDHWLRPEVREYALRRRLYADRTTIARNAGA